MKTRIRTLEGQIEKIKRELVSLGELHPGSLSQQYNVCGNPTCRCKEDPSQRHGPYHQLSFTRNGRSRTKFVRKPQLSAVKRHVKNYARLRTLVDQWIDLSSEVCRLKLEQVE